MNLFRSRAKVVLTGFLAFFVFMPQIHAQPTRADAEKDPVLKAMLTELDRSMSQLQLTGFAKPFFIQYRVEDVDDFQTKAEFGASEGSSHTHQRIARIRRYQRVGPAAGNQFIARAPARDQRIRPAAGLQRVVVTACRVPAR